MCCSSPRSSPVHQEDKNCIPPRISLSSPHLWPLSVISPQEMAAWTVAGTVIADSESDGQLWLPTGAFQLARQGASPAPDLNRLVADSKSDCQPHPPRSPKWPQTGFSTAKRPNPAQCTHRDKAVHCAGWAEHNHDSVTHSRAHAAHTGETPEAPNSGDQQSLWCHTTSSIKGLYF